MLQWPKNSVFGRHNDLKKGPNYDKILFRRKGVEYDKYYAFTEMIKCLMEL